MPTRKLKNWINSYLQYSQHSEAPEQFHFWTAVSVLGGALRRRVWIDQGYFQWTPNFYIVFVAPPGIVSKSTTASIGTRLLRQIPDIKFGPDAVTWQALTESLAASTEEVEIGGAYHPMSCITIVSSEFGTFLNPADREMVDVLVSLWDGQLGTWEKATKTQGSDIIVNPWINVIACTTPAWIAGNFPDYMIGGGFTSRCVFVYAEEKRQLVAYPKEHIQTGFHQLEKDLVHDLEIISQLKGEVTLSADALALGRAWYEEHYTSRSNSNLDEAKFGGYRARKQTHIHKLAIVLSAAESDDLTIQKSHLQRAIDIVTDLEKDMPHVFGLIGRTIGAASTEIVVSVIERYGAIDKSTLYRELFRNLSAKEIEEGILAATQAGIVKQIQQQGRMILFSEARVKELAAEREKVSGTSH